VLQSGTFDGPARAEVLFVKAADLARSQDAAGWQLRIATSLASLWRQSGRVGQARAVLDAARTAVKQEHESRGMLRARELHRRF